MASPDESVLSVRRSVHIRASPERVWREFASPERMSLWWGKVIGATHAGTSQGQRLVAYEPRLAGRAEMEVDFDGKPARFGGPIVTFASARELTIENDWIPSRGRPPTYITLRLSPALGGTLVELFHHGFELIGSGASAEHAAYEQGWGMTQLNALKEIAEGDG